MVNIVNVTRTYRFSDGITLVNTQLESELSNMVDTVNKNFSLFSSLNNTVSSTSFLLFPASGVYGDATSISLSSGNWLVNCMGVLTEGNLEVHSGFHLGISTTSGNSSTGLTTGDNLAIFGNSSTLETFDYPITLSIPSYRMSLSSTTTVYLKYQAWWSGNGAPLLSSRISAIRIS